MLSRDARRWVSFGIGAFLALQVARSASAAPFWLEGLGDYRIVDASGRVAPRVEADGSGRNAYKPVFAPPPLLRSRPIYPSGYAGARYDRAAGLSPTGYRKACGHTEACRHGR